MQHKKRGAAGWLLSLCLVMWPPAMASNRPQVPDVSVPAPDCLRPARPAQSEDRFQMWDDFMAQTDAYRDCMSNYIHYHHAASDAHRAAANAATEAWNSFVRESLNVPQDFPWPPPAPAQ